MNTLCKIRFVLSVLFFGSSTFILWSQDIDSYRFTISATYLPSLDTYSEIYEMKNGKITHQVIEYKKTKNRYETKNADLLLNDTDITRYVALIDSIVKINTFKIKLTDTIIQDMKTGWRYYKTKHNISDDDIETLIEPDSTVNLNCENIAENLTDELSSQIDGAYYEYNLIVKKSQQDIVFKTTLGSGGISNRQIKDWLIIYNSLKNIPFCSIPGLEKLFSNHNLENIIFRFILWNKY